MSESLLPSEAAIGKRFICRNRQFFPSGFKGVKVIQEGHHIILSRMAYIYTKGKHAHAFLRCTKLDLNRTSTKGGTTEHRFSGGRLAWTSIIP